ncbi:type I-E CRISPR-associated protein Cse2/CasB [Streptomyces hesseae]|uniref:Type I-E CRISPR-associated protein Cse2/CasB n=1 Tax=Streptomyces hesseae TaxID=3075519 RepID=A0ABU2SXC0_9ACTN|nr:type I-E CRISPR-associated protein Cse2/CasB [Streptomyces sp. DSM 40473]MDT0453662.1 type I-E CRISPR-associated protein Cse2/CasB [Streptomyces sp. DSM 40473]
MTAPAQDPPTPSPGQQLTAWLCGLVRARQYGQLADLRRPAALTQARLTAANFAPSEDSRHIFEQVAFLFARYHAGRLDPSPGAGDTGAALRRIGTGAGRGPTNPGAVRLLDRVVASRRIPWRHLQHAIERARSCDTIPPSWTTLTEDLSGWSRKGRPVQYQWARSFYTPSFTPEPRETALALAPIGDTQ